MFKNKLINTILLSFLTFLCAININAQTKVYFRPKDCSGGDGVLTQSDVNAKLKSIKGHFEAIIEKGITEIGKSAFEGRVFLVSVGKMKEVTKIGESAFEGCEKLTSVGDMGSVKTISDRAFYDCEKLTSVGDMNSLKTIGDRAFYECKQLKSVGNMISIETIGGSAFFNCVKLKSVGIMRSLEWIGDYAFFECFELESITILTPTPPTLNGQFVFDNIPDACTLYVSDLKAKNIYETNVKENTNNWGQWEDRKIVAKK